jgi:D-alanyl-lipoteichoic acid acyltransferase DltB (MBOAT superfamily)
MLFNSYEFILLFLPITVIGFLALGLMSRQLAMAWVILASIFFYAWWRPFNLAIIGPSLVVNYFLGRWLLGLQGDASKSRTRAFALTIGIIFNIAFLGYFKYANFAVSVAHDVTGRNFVFEEVILPLGISFITFQKIAFLVDVAGGKIKSFSVRDFLLFVLFFPQLVAGPIVHYQESVPQFQAATAKFDKTAYAAGLTLFVFGLFKKVVLADGMAAHVSPVFAFAQGAGDPTMVQSWLAAIGYTLQLYFDFSGYSDMACGAALFFGVKLPMNFNSPLKAANIIDFWQRWHITLTRFLTAYIFTPISLNFTRQRAMKRLPPLRATGSKLGAFLQLLVAPTLVTMFISGVWHGAGYTFIIWGLLHGFYLVIAHAWRQYGPKKGSAPKAVTTDGAVPAAQSMVPSALVNFIAQRAGWMITFLAIAVSMVFFRAPDVGTAVDVLKGMTGLNGVGLPQELADRVHMASLGGMKLAGGEVYLHQFIPAAGFLIGLFAIAILMPNSLQVMEKFKPTLTSPNEPPKIAGFIPSLRWNPSLPWMGFFAVLALVAMLRMSGPSEFLYWQF